MSKLLKLGTIAGLLLLSANVYATTIQANYTVNANTSDPGLVIETAENADNPFTFDLAVGEQHTFNLFDIWTDEAKLNADDEVHMPISVDFDFLMPEIGSGTVTGETYGQFTGFLFFQNGEGALSWDNSTNPLSFSYGPNNDGLIYLTLSDATFDEGVGSYLPGNLGAGEWFKANVQATLELVSDASPADVPEPGTLALFGLVLVVIGFAAQRRRGNRKS